MGRRTLRFSTYVALVGHLLLRSMDRAQRVYQAMVSRGFAGEFRVLRPAALCWKDVAFMGGWIGYFAAARAWDLAGARMLALGIVQSQDAKPVWWRSVPDLATGWFHPQAARFHQLAFADAPPAQ